MKGGHDVAQQTPAAPASATDSTITFAMEPQTGGYPVLVDDGFRAALANATKGGIHTRGYFDAVNATAAFWGKLASKEITLAPGKDPDGRPVLMASSGNIELRVQAVYAGPSGRPAATDGHPPFGIVTVTTHNTTTRVSQWFAVLARVGTMPEYLPITADLFAKLVAPLYSNTKALLGTMADKLRAAAAVEAPEIDASVATEAVLAEQNAVVEDVSAELGEQGVEYMAIEWGAVGLDVAGLAPLMAIPMIVEFLGHKMTHSLIVQNMSDVGFTIDLAQYDGATMFLPAGSSLPKLTEEDDPLHAGRRLAYSYQANYQFINSSDFGAIRYLMTLYPDDGSPAASMAITIPWSGDNSIWVGSASSSEGAVDAADAKGDEVVTAVFGSYRVTLSINALSGTSDGSYFYCSMAVVEPA